MQTETRADPFAVRPPGHFADLDVSNDFYHRECDGISNSMESVFIEDPALFEGYFISHRYQKPPSTQDQEFGSLVHAVILEDGLSRIVEIPPGVLAKDGSRRGSAWHLFCAENEGKSLLKPEEVTTLREIRRRVEDHPQAAPLLFESDGTNETSIEWTDPDTGLLLRSRRDRITTAYYGRRVVADVKTTARVDPKSFAEACWRWGYHRQAAFYLAGADVEYDGADVSFVFVAIRKTPPYSVRCYDLSDEFLNLGRDEMRRGLEGLARARDDGIWAPETADQILQLDCPRRAKYESDWEIE